MADGSEVRDMSKEDPKAQRVSLDEKVKAEELLYASLFHKGDNRLMGIGLIVAIAIHLIVLIAPLPDFKRAMKPKTPKKAVFVRKYVPPPPPVQKRQVQKKKLTKKVPIPDPTPDEPEPIREPEPEIEPEPLPPDAEIFIGVPEPPPPTGPVLAGVDGVTNPERIPESYIKPVYPELARKARIETKLILQAVIHKDGSVGEIDVLQCKRPGLGFEEEAISAVSQWRYKPALQNGRPVEVYFTIRVDFTLQ
jgi:protein TonB